MTQTTKYCIRILAANLAFLLILLIPSFIHQNTDSVFMSCIFFGFALFLELIIGFGLAMNKKNREVGRAMIISVGIFFLIGFSACTVMMTYN